jgi:GNAT superfamily N-acetyltransferase
MSREITVRDCEHAQTSWYLTGARLLGGEAWSEGGLTWARGSGHADLLFPREIDRDGLARGLARARRPGQIVGAWLSLEIDAAPLADAGFERGWAPWWMSANISEIGETDDPRVRLKETTTDYTGEHAAYARMLELTRQRPQHSWYAAAYVGPNLRFAGQAWSHLT